MQDFEPKQQIDELLNGYRSVDSSFPGRVAKALDGVIEDLRERAKVAGGLTEEVETIRQERETEVHNICQGNRKLELTALAEIRTFAVRALSIIEEIILRRDGSRDFARAGEDLYEQSGAYRRLKEQIGHLQSVVIPFLGAVSMRVFRRLLVPSKFEGREVSERLMWALFVVLVQPFFRDGPHFR